MSAATTSTTFKYDTEVGIPGTALLNLACEILDKYQKSRWQQYKEADRIDDDDARVDAGEFLVDCQQAQWLIDRQRYQANLPESESSIIEINKKELTLCVPQKTLRMSQEVLI